MRPTFEIVVEPTSLVAHGEGPTTGNLWVRVADVPFPAEHWNDFAIAILGGWSDVLSTARGNTRPQPLMLRFMDGPYALDLRKVDSLWRLRAISTASARTRILSQTATDLEVVSTSLLRAVALVVPTFSKTRTRDELALVRASERLQRPWRGSQENNPYQ